MPRQKIYKPGYMVPGTTISILSVDYTDSKGNERFVVERCGRIEKLWKSQLIKLVKNSNRENFELLPFFELRPFYDSLPNEKFNSLVHAKGRMKNLIEQYNKNPDDEKIKSELYKKISSHPKYFSYFDSALNSILGEHKIYINKWTITTKEGEVYLRYKQGYTSKEIQDRDVEKRWDDNGAEIIIDNTPYLWSGPSLAIKKIDTIFKYNFKAYFSPVDGINRPGKTELFQFENLDKAVELINSIYDDHKNEYGFKPLN
jgi:hypothetical protein